MSLWKRFGSDRGKINPPRTEQIVILPKNILHNLHTLHAYIQHWKKCRELIFKSPKQHQELLHQHSVGYYNNTDNLIETILVGAELSTHHFYNGEITISGWLKIELQGIHLSHGIWQDTTNAVMYYPIVWYNGDVYVMGEAQGVHNNAGHETVFYRNRGIEEFVALFESGGELHNVVLYHWSMFSTGLHTMHNKDLFLNIFPLIFHYFNGWQFDYADVQQNFLHHVRGSKWNADNGSEKVKKRYKSFKIKSEKLAAHLWAQKVVRLRKVPGLKKC